MVDSTVNVEPTPLNLLSERLKQLPLPDRLKVLRRLAVPIPWAPPMPCVPWLPSRVYRDLIAEAAASRIRGLTPALEQAGLEGCAFELERVVRILEAVPMCRSEVA